MLMCYMQDERFEELRPETFAALAQAEMELLEAETNPSESTAEELMTWMRSEMDHDALTEKEEADWVANLDKEGVIF